MECNDVTEQNVDRNTSNADVISSEIDTIDEASTEPQSEKLSDTAEAENVDTDALIESLIESHFNESAENDASITRPDDASGNDLPAANEYIDNSVDMTENEDTATENQDTATVHPETNIPKKPAIPKPEKLCQLPLGSVKRIVKSDPDVTLVSAESVFLITRATVSYFP